MTESEPKPFNKVEQVGAGGQAVVWKATATGTGEVVAMKIFTPPPQTLDIDSDRKRFLREVRCQSEMDHPNIVRVVAFSSTDDPPWYVMPWASETLRDVVANNPSGLPEEEALEVFAQILEGMQHAHSEGVLHRDLKPENVLVIDDQYKVSDFGLGRRLDSGSTTLTMSSMGFGTIAYSAPEQFTDVHQAGAPADVYALGKILYELLTGRMPFPNIDYPAVGARYRYVIRRCLEDDPARRYQSVRELANELQLLVDDSDELHSPSDRATKLMEQAAGGDRSAVGELSRLLIENGDDDQLYTKFVPYLTSQAIENFANQDPSALLEILKNFDRVAEGGHPWSFTDVIADFLFRAFVRIDDDATREMILGRLLVLGHDHSRWHVGDVFANAAGQLIQESAGGLTLARVLRENREAIAFIDGKLRELPLPNVVLAVLDGTDPNLPPEPPPEEPFILI